VIEKEYLEMHAGDFYRELALHFKGSGFFSFEFIDEFLLEFIWEDYKKAVKILDETHDHTDSYFLEAKMQKVLSDKGWKLLFVDESEGVEKAKQQIEVFLKSV
tara:strand:+ start:1073 stop:1381 length:309 start_codon:yes stop_codon:yes gene_type:complete